MELNSSSKEGPCRTMKRALLRNRRTEELFLKTLLNGRMYAEWVRPEWVAPTALPFAAIIPPAAQMRA